MQALVAHFLLSLVLKKDNTNSNTNANTETLIS